MKTSTYEDIFPIADVSIGDFGCWPGGGDHYSKINDDDYSDASYVYRSQPYDPMGWERYIMDNFVESMEVVGLSIIYSVYNPAFPEAKCGLWVGGAYYEMIGTMVTGGLIEYELTGLTNPATGLPYAKSDLDGAEIRIGLKSPYPLMSTQLRSFRFRCYYPDAVVPSNGQRIECAFNQSIFTLNPVWTDVSSEVLKLHTKRGRNHALGRIEAGEMQVTVDNAAGNWWRKNAAGAYYSLNGGTENVKPLTPIRAKHIYTVWESEISYTTYTNEIWRGVIEGLEPGFVTKRGGYTPIMELSCVDVFKAFSRFNIYDANPALTANAPAGQTDVVVDDISALKVGQHIRIYDNNHSKGDVLVIASITPATNTVRFTSYLTYSYAVNKKAKLKKFPQVLSGARIQDVLLELGWSPYRMLLDYGKVQVIELNKPKGEDPNVPSNNYNIPPGGINAMEHLQAVAEAEDGIIFERPDGYIVFQDSEARQQTPYDTVQEIFSDQS